MSPRCSDIADSLIDDGWFNSDHKTVHNAIRNLSDTRLMLIMLIHIARSLRVLRCPNFQRIPVDLNAIKTYTRRIRPRTKKVK